MYFDFGSVKNRRKILNPRFLINPHGPQTRGRLRALIEEP